MMRLVVSWCPRAECHLRIDDDVIFSLGNIIVESAVDDTAVSDDDGLEAPLIESLQEVFNPTSFF